jgi:hypothetical protein
LELELKLGFGFGFRQPDYQAFIFPPYAFRENRAGGETLAGEFFPRSVKAGKIKA